MNRGLALAINREQLAHARFEESAGLYNHALLLGALHPDRARRGPYADVVRGLLSERSVHAISVMHGDGESTFAPGFAIPEEGGRAGAQSIADADAASLDRLLRRVYGQRPPLRWRKVLDAPRVWLEDVARAHAAISNLSTELRRSERVQRAYEIERFDAAAGSREGLALHVAAAGLLRLTPDGITTSWDQPVSLSFSRSLRFAPLPPGGGFLILLRDVDGARDVDALVAQKLGRPPTERWRDRSLELLAGASRAAILRSLERPVSINELARRLRFTPATVSYHVGRLEQAQLVRVDRDKGRSWVSLSADGRALLDLFS